MFKKTLCLFLLSLFVATACNVYAKSNKSQTKSPENQQREMEICLGEGYQPNTDEYNKCLESFTRPVVQARKFVESPIMEEDTSILGQHSKYCVEHGYKLNSKSYKKCMAMLEQRKNAYLQNQSRENDCKAKASSLARQMEGIAGLSASSGGNAGSIAASERARVNTYGQQYALCMGDNESYSQLQQMEMQQNLQMQQQQMQQIQMMPSTPKNTHCTSDGIGGFICRQF